MEFDGTGKIFLTAGISNVAEDVLNDPNAPPVSEGIFGIHKRGTGVLLVNVGAGNNNHNGPTRIFEGNFHYADNGSLNVGGGSIIVAGGAVGVDTGVVGNTQFNGLIDPSSTGGLMIPADPNGRNSDALDFVTDLTNAAGMTVAAPETGVEFTGTIAPANSTYGLGGGEGTLTLPNATLTGANDLEVRNGGLVQLLGDNTYTGETQIRSDVEVDDLADTGTASSLGTGSVDDTILVHGATLKYTGTGDSTNRELSIGTAGATIDSSGTGALVFSNTGAVGRRDLTRFVGTLDNSTRNPNQIYDISSDPNGGGDVRDLVPGMQVNDFGESTPFSFETVGACGGDTGLEAGDFNNSGRNCIPLFVDPNGHYSNTNTAPAFDPNSGYLPVRIEVTGVGSDNDLPNLGSVVTIAPNDDFLPDNFFNDDVDGFVDVNLIPSIVNKVDTTITVGATGRTLTLTGDNAGNNEIAGDIADSAAGSVVSIEKTGSGKWILSGNNTYTGDTTVEEGILSIESDFLDPNSSVRMTGTGVLDLNFVGTDIVENLFFTINDKVVEQAEGIWGAIGSGATFESSFFTGTGFLNVGNVPLSALASVPEPSSFLLVSMACLGMMRNRRRTLR